MAYKWGWNPNHLHPSLGVILQARITRANDACHHDGRPRGAMSTLFALEGVNFFDAFTFEVFGRWDLSFFFS